MTFAKPKKLCSRACAHVNLSALFSGPGNPAHGKTYRTKATHPEWAAQISETQKLSDHMKGDNNPMRRSDVAEKMSKTRRKHVTSDPEYRAERSRYMLDAWANGKYDGVAVGKCKWYDHIKPDGSTVKLQGTWEVAFARWLDAANLTYEAHRGRWKFTDGAGVQRNYYPDFYVHAWDTAVDVKGAFWDAEQAAKLDFVRTANPSKHLIIANKRWLDDHGVDYLSVQRELLAAPAVSKKGQ